MAGRDCRGLCRRSGRGRMGVRRPWGLGENLPDCGRRIVSLGFLKEGVGDGGGFTGRGGVKCEQRHQTKFGMPM
jgi:hypothetical protein